MTAPKRRNPQDSTLRNIRALKKRVAKLEAQMRAIKKAIWMHLPERTAKR